MPVLRSLPAASRFVEGLRRRTLPIKTVQCHSEGGPGPLDALAVFDRFMKAARTRHGDAQPEPAGGYVSRSASTRPN